MYYKQHPFETSITKLDHLLGKQVEVIAFGISYVGKLEQVDFENGQLVISDDHDKAVLDLERVESFNLIEC